MKVSMLEKSSAVCFCSNMLLFISILTQPVIGQPSQFLYQMKGGFDHVRDLRSSGGRSSGGGFGGYSSSRSYSSTATQCVPKTAEVYNDEYGELELVETGEEDCNAGGTEEMIIAVMMYIFCGICCVGLIIYVIYLNRGNWKKCCCCCCRKKNKKEKHHPNF